MEKHFGLRIDGDILAKFRYVCAYVGRSANGGDSDGCRRYVEVMYAA